MDVDIGTEQDQVVSFTFSNYAIDWNINKLKTNQLFCLFMENDSLLLYQAGTELQNNKSELFCLILSFLYVTIALHCLSLIIVGGQSCVTREGGVACTKVKNEDRASSCQMVTQNKDKGHSRLRAD